MATKNSCAMLMLAVVAAVSLNTAAQAQQASRSARYSKITVRRDTTRGGPSKLKVLRPAPNTNHRPKQTETQKRFAAAAAVMAPYKEWMIGANRTGFVYPNTKTGPVSRRYNLKGTAITKFLQYEKQGTFGGINLGWTKNASARTAIDRGQWIFQRPGGGGAPLVYGELLALGWSKSGKAFLKYSKRNVGINLTWSDPAYEWTILGGTPGTRVRRGQDLVILYSLGHLMPMMYVDRTKGGHIGWPDSSKWTQTNHVDAAYLSSMRLAAFRMMGKPF